MGWKWLWLENGEERKQNRRVEYNDVVGCCRQQRAGVCPVSMSILSVCVYVFGEILEGNGTPLGLVYMYVR